MFQTMFRLLSQNSELSIKAGQVLYETNEPTVNLLNQWSGCRDSRASLIIFALRDSDFLLPLKQWPIKMTSSPLPSPHLIRMSGPKLLVGTSTAVEVHLEVRFSIHFMMSSILSAYCTLPRLGFDCLSPRTSSAKMSNSYMALYARY